MATNLRTSIEEAFADLLDNLEVELGIADGELQIVADDWTLVLEGDPITSALIAVDDEDPAPELILDDVLPQHHEDALKALDAALEGSLATALSASPDPLAKALASRIS